MNVSNKCSRHVRTVDTSSPSGSSRNKKPLPASLVIGLLGTEPVAAVVLLGLVGREVLPAGLVIVLLG